MFTLILVRQDIRRHNAEADMTLLQQLLRLVLAERRPELVTNAKSMFMIHFLALRVFNHHLAEAIITLNKQQS